MYYKIGERLEEVKPKSFENLGYQYVAVISSQEWVKSNKNFGMGIEWDINLEEITDTHAEVNIDSLTGTFSIPSRKNTSGPKHNFAFALDEKGIVFVDDEGFAGKIVEKIAQTKKYINPCLERFLYDFLESIIHRDYKIIERYDARLDEIEKDVLSEESSGSIQELTDIRSELRDLRIHYAQLMDLSQELEENENEFFKEDNERYFHLVFQRVQTLHEMTSSLADYTSHIRDLNQTQIDIKQNKIMTILTVVTSIFMPLTLITGWYGMNFVHMPELKEPAAYPIVITVCILIVIGCLVFFKRKKWL
ncbi:MAG TPA: magnesium transporter CorA [Clostridiales bacterium]|nr:CorA family divalent cation transporter [Saccharofermentanaceae bacterium]HAU50165.1 magnesium transporter CorA [Clostridiales bacterium]HBY32484.1 magnesium transporter CorA [Clostridiales bacterium]HBZ78284.1 magnesium transporter CorA [Clostridiales bacterium]